MNDWPNIEGVDSTALEIIRNHCGWHIAPTITEQLVLDGEGSSTIILPTLHVVNVTEVWVHNVKVENFSFSTAGILYLSTRVFGAQAVRLTLTHGYQSLPLSLVRAALRVGQLAGAFPFSSASVDGVAFSGGVGGVDPVTALTLEPYQRPSLP